MAEESEFQANVEAGGQSASARRVELSAKPIGWMINIISIVAGFISVTVIGGVIILALTGSPIPDELSNWGGIILGFYFGQFISLVKDYMGMSSGK